MNFKELMLAAQVKEELATKQLLDMYRPLLIKESIVENVYDEDLYQELSLILLKCVQKFTV